MFAEGGQGFRGDIILFSLKFYVLLYSVCIWKAILQQNPIKMVSWIFFLVFVLDNVFFNDTYIHEIRASIGGGGMDKVEWAMSSGSIIQGMFPLQPTSEWVGRSDSWDETLDRTNPPWLYHPGFLQILHAPKGAQNIFLTWFIESSFSFTYLYSSKLSVWVKCDHRSLFLQLYHSLCFIWITDWNCLPFLFVFGSSAPSSGH